MNITNSIIKDKLYKSPPNIKKKKISFPPSLVSSFTDANRGDPVFEQSAKLPDTLFGWLEGAGYCCYPLEDRSARRTSGMRPPGGDVGALYRAA